MLENIQSALKSFSNGNLTENALNLFQTLGYESERQMPFEDKSFADFSQYITEDSKFSEKNAFVEEWQYVDLLFQLTESELSEQFSMFDKRKIEKEQFNSYLFFAIELNEKKLNGKEFTRTDLANITREINKCFPMPVFVLFKLGSFLTFSVINRRLHKKDETKDVIEIKKVSLIKDIDFQKPKRSHLEILKDLSLAELQKKHKFQNFVELHKAWMATLDTKELNKRFFRELSNWYFWAVSQVAFPRDANDEDSEETHSAKSVIRLITRLMFVWFLKEKGLISDELFNKRELDGILKFSDESAFYKAILQNLFFATLNTDGEDAKTPRKFRGENDGSWYKGNLGIANVFRYKSEFLKPEDALEKYFLKVPFLNGGLFECLDKPEEKIYVDGFSERKDNVLSVADELFFCESREVDLNSVFYTTNKKYEVRGLIRILDNYKFTIAENTPIEEEIALDPELLGKVFENLLANYNPETRTTARKQTGSFYTPREIVNYMVDESLIAYLKAKLQTETKGFGFIAFGESQETLFGNEARIQQKFEMPLAGNRWLGKDADLEKALRDLFSYDETENQFNELETEILIKAINDCKILDPACGSGAFPMGILQRLVFLLGKLDKDNVKWRELQKQEALRQIETAYDELKDKDERQKRLDEIDEVFDLNSSDYGRKLFLIENCIYGVDIQPVAIQISKLRFFISLIIDQKIDDTRPNRGVRPLPNLETKLVAANTLLGLEAQAMLKPGEVNNLEKELKQVRSKIFRARTPSTKLKWRNEDKRIRTEIADLLKQTGYAPDAADKIANWSPDNQDAHADWFDKEWMFGIEKGFDIVIGNPPYLREKGNASFFEPVNHSTFGNNYHQGKMDFWFYFLHRAIDISNKKTIISFITPRYWINSTGAGKLIKRVKEKLDFKVIVDIGKLTVFESVAGQHLIAIYTKDKKINSEILYKKLENKLSDIAKNYDTNNVSISTLSNTSVYTEGNEIIFEKNSNKLKNVIPLGNLYDVSQGIVEAVDRISKKRLESFPDEGFHAGKGVFVLSKKELEELNFNETEKKLAIKEYLEPTDIKKYSIQFNGDYVIYSDRSVKELIGNSKLPNIKRHLDSVQNFITSSNKPYGLHRPRETKFFENNKIIFKGMFVNNEFAIDYQQRIAGMSFSLIIQKEKSYSLEYLLAILNSKFALSWFLKNSKHRGVGVDVGVAKLRTFPISKATDAQQTEIAEIVDEIIKAKQQDAKADTKELEGKIDKLVYRLYDLTEEEINIVEGKT